MWRRISHALAWVFYGKSNVSLCAEMARRRAACRFCRCVCRVLEFVPTFGPGHCDDELEMYEMKTTRKPGPLTKQDNKFWSDFQKVYNLKADGKPGHQTTGQVVIVLDHYQRQEKAKDNQLHNTVILFSAVCAALVIVLVTLL